MKMLEETSESNSMPGKVQCQDVSPVPGVFLTLLLCVLGLVASPSVLTRIFYLNFLEERWWYIALGVQIFVLLLAIVAWFTRRWVNFIFATVVQYPKELVIALVAIAVALATMGFGLEIVMRIKGIPFDHAYYIPSENSLAKFDPELGWSYIPETTVTQKFGDAQREVAMHFDSIGSRVRASNIDRDLSMPTIIIVGGSLAMGHGLPYEETFAGQLESMSGFGIRVVNLAVQAYGTDQSLVILRRHIDKFNIAAVVHAYTFSEIYRNANYDRRVLLPWMHFIGTKPMFALDRKGNPYLSKEPLTYEDYRYSRLWAYLKVQLNLRGPRPTADLTRALVREMRDLVESKGAVFLLVNWEWELGKPQPHPFQSMDINAIDTSANSPDGWLDWRIPGDGHPNARAHSRVASLILAELDRLGVERFAADPQSPISKGDLVP